MKKRQIIQQTLLSLGLYGTGDESGDAGGKLLTGPFCLLLGSSLLMITGIGMFYMFPLFVLELGGSRADIGLLMGLMSLAAVAGRPLVSNMVDRIGRKKSMISGCLVMAVVSLLHLLLGDTIESVYPILILLRLFFGVALALGIVASLTMAADMVAGPRLNEGMGIFGIMPMLGLALGPLLGELMVTRLGFHSMFLGATSVFVLSIFLLCPLRDTFQDAGTLSKSGFFRVLAFPLVWRMALMSLFFGAAFAAHAGFVAPYAHAYDIPASAYFGSYSTAAILSRLFLGRLARFFGEMLLIPAALIIAGIGFVSLIAVSNTLGLIMAGFVAGLGHGLFFPSLIALTIRHMVASNRGKVAGILTGGFDSGIFLGSLVMGQLGDFFGFSAVFGSAAAIAFIGFVSFQSMKSRVISV
ncbi:MAG: MFS transporter [Desulforhopalus sp.]